jgi:glutathione S-transferase
MITVFGGTPQFGLADFSPACLKVKTYLRMREIPYESKQGMPQKGPTKKIPYVRFDDGAIVGDSELIIGAIHERFGNPLDAHLTNEQHALGHVIRRTLEENLYWVTVLARWRHDAAYVRMKRVFSGMLPPVIGPLIMRSIRKGSLANAWGQGLGRHKDDHVWAAGKADLDAVAIFVGEKPFLFGDSPTTYDAAIYGQIANAFAPEFDNPLSAYAKTHRTLRAYCERITARYFPPV